jgi:mannosyl-3-phosphoglycerate phosphatase
MLTRPLVVFTEPLDLFLVKGHPVEGDAAPALHELERHHVPLVFVSHGTRMEVELVRRGIGNAHPLISEGGAGLFVPEGYFRQRIPEATMVRHYHRVSLARPYAETCATLEETAAEARAEVVGFHQMSVREVAENGWLTQRLAELARMREFDEPFFFAGEEEESCRRLTEAARLRSYQVRRGERFWHFSSGADVGRAVRRLMELYRESRRMRMRSIAIGWSQNHLPMLAAASCAIVLPAPNGKHDENVPARLRGARKADEGGAAGWSAAVLELLGEDSR